MGVLPLPKICPAIIEQDKDYLIWLFIGWLLFHSAVKFESFCELTWISEWKCFSEASGNTNVEIVTLILLLCDNDV